MVTDGLNIDIMGKVCSHESVHAHAVSESDEPFMLILCRRRVILPNHHPILYHPSAFPSPFIHEEIPHDGGGGRSGVLARGHVLCRRCRLDGRGLQADLRVPPGHREDQVPPAAAGPQAPAVEDEQDGQTPEQDGEARGEDRDARRQGDAAHHAPRHPPRGPRHGDGQQAPPELELIHDELEQRQLRDVKHELVVRFLDVFFDVLGGVVGVEQLIPFMSPEKRSLRAPLFLCREKRNCLPPTVPIAEIPHAGHRMLVDHEKELRS
jgi:hypothetical protein